VKIQDTVACRSVNVKTRLKRTLVDDINVLVVSYSLLNLQACYVGEVEAKGKHGSWPSSAFSSYNLVVLPTPA
jgi:hypothetical protein